MVTPSVFVIDKSAEALSESLSVAELLAVFGSPLDVIVAVLASVPVAAAEIAQLAV